MLERVIENRVVRHAKKLEILCTKQNLMGFKGMPDRIFWLTGGYPLLIEFKREGAQPTELQKMRINELRKLGYWVEVFDNADAANALLDTVAYTNLIDIARGAKYGIY